MKVTVFNTIENIIQIPFIEDKFVAGSVCFANDPDVRADFKLQFTTYDVMNYVYGIYHLYWNEDQKREMLFLKIPYPMNAAFFWKHSNIGEKKRQEHPIDEIEFMAVDKFNWKFIL